VNLVVVGGVIDPEDTGDREERAECEKMHSLVEKYNLKVGKSGTALRRTLLMRMSTSLGCLCSRKSSLGAGAQHSSARRQRRNFGFAYVVVLEEHSLAHHVETDNQCASQTAANSKHRPYL
jgi:hypothetical protein